MGAIDKARQLGQTCPSVVVPHLHSHGWRGVAEDASRQPGSLQELMLHETAVAWVRRGLTWTLPARPWEETVEAFGARLREVVRKVNDEYNVAGLCKELSIRVESLYHAEGGKLQK